MTARCAIYVRISKDRTGEALGVERQEQDCRELAARLGWDVFDVYSDNDISAYSGKSRPDYQRMLDDIRAHRVDAIVAWDTSRLYRQLRDLLELIDTCDEHGVVSIETVQAGKLDLSTHAGRSMAKILATINEQYSSETSDRIKRKKRELAERGLESGGGMRRFGFTGTGKHKVTRLRALQEQEHLREAVTYLLEGGTIFGLTRQWKGRVPTVNGGQWRGSQIRKLLLSPAIAGKTQYNGQYFDAQWPAIIPFEQWERLRDLLTAPERVTNRGSNNRKYILSGGVLRCGLCRGPMAGTLKKRYENGKTIGGHRIYRCPPSMGGCGRVARQADAIEELVCEAIFAAVESEAWDARVRETSSEDGQVRVLLERRAEITGLLDRLEDKMVRELISEAGYKRNRMELEEELDGINRQLDRLQDSTVVPAVPRNLRDIWPSLAAERQREIVRVVLRATGRRLVVYPQKRGWPFDPSSVVPEPVELPA